MEINDKVYGKQEINEQILIDLINSSSVQRLKNLSQWGIPDKYYHLKGGFSRYDHSMGVMIFLRKLGADLNEQIAGLLHDISHTAFSHVVDWAIGDPTKEDYQDSIHEEVINNSDVSKILDIYNTNKKEISTLEDFSLLERDAPLLCVDRVDYSLRELEWEGKRELIKLFISNLFNKNGEVVFGDERIAEKFGREYMRMQNEHWAGNQARLRYYILANVLKRALKSGIISYKNLRETDDFVLKILEKSNDKEILKNLNLLKTNFDIESVNDGQGVGLRKKFRYVNPGVFVNGFIKRLSELSSDYKEMLKLETEKSKSIKFFRVVSG